MAGRLVEDLLTIVQKKVLICLQKNHLNTKVAALITCTQSHTSLLLTFSTQNLCPENPIARQKISRVNAHKLKRQIEYLVLLHVRHSSLIIAL